MPASDISRISVSGAPHVDLVANIAKEIAQREIALRLQRGVLNPNDRASIKREYNYIYSQEYYKYYAWYFQQQSQEQQPKVIYVSKENPTSKRYITWHTAYGFTRQNCLIHCKPGEITLSRITYPLNDDRDFPETQESFITDWPGPLDRCDDNLDEKVTSYIETLRQHDSQRRIKYHNSTNDDYRKTILKLLTELVIRKGSIDAPGVSRLLLDSKCTEIKKVESEKQPLVTLQKYLLLGKRSEAIKYAKSKNLWDHAQCLAFLDKYQPPRTSNYIRDTSVRRLRDDPIVQLNDEYITDIGGTNDHGILSTVYRSLLNTIIRTDPESMNFIRLTNVENDAYNFAIMCANDCEIEFDRSNELFKLIMAVKQAKIYPDIAYSHLISLGYPLLDFYHDPYDDISAHSFSSIRQIDNQTPNRYSTISTISNIDMLIMNEIWEYCLNRSRNHNQSYRYILDLVPYKLIFAARMLDFGLHSMFADYLNSIKQALQPLRNGHDVRCNPFYDWTRIAEVVDRFEEAWGIVCQNHQLLDQHMITTGINNLQLNDMYAPEVQPPSYNPGNSYPSQAPLNDIPSNDFPDASDYGYTSLPYTQQSGHRYQMDQNYAPIEPPKQNIPPQFYNPPPPIPEETNDFNPDPIEPSEPNEPVEPQIDEISPPQEPQHDQRQSLPYEPPSFGSPVSAEPEQQMTSSSPVSKNRDSMPNEDRQSGFLQGLTTKFSQILPRNQSKQMILPDDSPDNQKFIFDNDKNCWVDKSNPDGGLGDSIPEPPPMMKAASPPEYSFNLKSSKMRYAKP